MKLPLLILFCLMVMSFALVSPCLAQGNCTGPKPPRNDLEREHLNGRVKVVSTTDKEVCGPVKWIDTFNAAGNILVTRMSLGPGIGTTREEYRYDNKGKKIEQISYNADGSVKRKTIYRYDDEGREISSVDADYTIATTYSGSETRSVITIPSGGRETTIIVWECDGRSNIIREQRTYYDTDDKKERSTTETRTYDAQNRVTLIALVEEREGTVTETKKGYGYDSKRNVTEEVSYTPAGAVDPEQSWVYVYEYDAKGNWIKRSTSVLKYRKQNPVNVQVRRIWYY